MFENYIREMLEIHQNNSHVYWDIYLDKVRGFTELETQAFADALDIELHPQLKYFFTTFGCCSGGLFRWHPYFLYSPSDTLQEKVDISLGTSKAIFDNKVITQKELDMKPYVFGTWDHCYFLLVFTKDKDLLVWEYDDNNEKIHCTGMNYLEFSITLIRSISHNSLLSRDYIKNKRLTKE